VSLNPEVVRTSVLKKLRDTITKYAKAKEVVRHRGQLVEACQAILIFVRVEAICLFSPAVFTAMFTLNGQVNKDWSLGIPARD
jgi:hypothetical protein